MTEKSTEETVTATAATIGKWLFDEIQKIAPQHVYQSNAVHYIRTNFGKNWSYQNTNGNWAINKEILAEFNKLKPADPNIQWLNGSQSWQRMSDELLERTLAKKDAKKSRKEELKRLRDEREK